MNPLIIGHRGAAAVAPENTLASFERALRDGADGIEFDVRLARDGVPVVIHDATL
ncbi:MAG: glycerophosphodiester phosphodiesterase, partial [Acidobacteriota bacterium]|nr:glycerophosphodiester phosphodiesterase [Acidobacteriota bacterium]